MSKKSQNKEKDKVKYYDDGSTIADMDCLNDAKKKPSRIDEVPNPKRQPKVKSTYREKAQTFFETFKMMLVPTGIALLVIFILYLICLFVFSK